MFCGSCGQEVTSQDKFCGSCGAPVPQDIQEGGILEGESTSGKKDFIPEPVARELETANQEISATLEMPIPREVVVKAPMSKKTKIIIGTIAVIAVALYGGYQYARSKFTVTSPYLLEQKFTTALKSQDMATLSSLLDSDSADLKSADSLAAFKKGISDEVVAAYLQRLQQEVGQVQGGNAFASTSDHGWLTLRQTSTWLGKSWAVHIASVGVKANPIPQDTVSFSIGNLKSANEEITHLWPSEYSFKGTVSNNYAQENVNGTVSFLDQLGNIPNYGEYDYNLDMSGLIKSRLQLNSFNAIPNLQITLNDKPVTITGDNVLISPAPQNPALSVKGTVLGVPISEKGTIDPQDQNPIQTLVNQGIAKHAMDILDNFNVAATKALDDGTPSEMQGDDPNSAERKSYSDFITNNAASPNRVKDVFLKTVVDPNSVNIQDGKIYINDTEYYTRNSSPNTINWTYQLQQIPGKSEWWVEGNNQDYETVNDTTGKFTKLASQ
ncbi:hypothetical protein DEAC_c43720 [Desulfosporosinus acididurans]|uniref:Zinc-ribbon domain-containing protein n=1 Tax=Desulfosporosinus acididurans TaxID=476652 RepID=A0A0J1IG46_9FIRM|nr:hypothetical protein [Desulfosporosinus acididurans]KLU63711.1 hypothetical protein DEAC_c43720 [Desulfosporosinus acididurans]